MEGLGRALGAPVSFEIEGKRYVTNKLSGKLYGELEQEILKNRPNPVEAIQPYLADLDEDSRRVLLQEAYKDLRNGNKVSAIDIANYIDSFQGICFCMWMCLRDNHPEVDSPEKARGIVESMGEDAMRKIFEQASGIDAAGNSTGPTPQAAPGSTGDPASTPLGEESSDNSASDTDGPPTK